MSNPITKDNKLPAKPVNDYLKAGEVSTPAKDSVNALQTLTAPTTLNKYDRTWLNKELKYQAALLNADKEINTKIQIYENLPYTKNKFDYWMRKNGNTEHTQQLAKKIDEMLEARLVRTGFNARNPVFSIFLLKNHYGYQDVKNIETDNQYTFNVTRGLPAPKRTRKLIKATIKTN